jgi:hypothetical protein
VVTDFRGLKNHFSNAGIRMPRFKQPQAQKLMQQESCNMQRKLIRPSEYAKSRGLARSTVSRQIRAKQIPTHGGLVDPAEADEARRLNLDPSKRRKAADDDPPQPMQQRRHYGPTTDGTYLAARTKHEIAKAEKAALEAGLLRGLLVRTEEVKAAYESMISAVRTRFLSIGHKLGPLLAIEIEPIVCQSLVDEAVHEALHEFTEWRPAAPTGGRE